MPPRANQCSSPSVHVPPRVAAHYQPANSCLLASNQGKNTTIGFLLARSSQPRWNYLHRRSHMPPRAGGYSGTPPRTTRASSKPARASACWAHANTHLAHAGPRPAMSATPDPIRPEPPASDRIGSKLDLNRTRTTCQKRRRKNSRKMQNFQHSSEDPGKSLFALKTFKCVNLILAID